MLPYLHGRRLMNTHPGGGFSIMMQTAIIVGVVLALPVVIYQVWLFLAPALHRHEKKVVLPGDHRRRAAVRLRRARSRGTSCCR